MEDILAGIKLVNYRNVQEISQRLLVNLKAPTVTENRQDDKYALGKLRSKSGRNALSLLLYYVLILYITPHLSEVQNFQLDCVEVDLQEKNTCSFYYQRLVT